MYEHLKRRIKKNEHWKFNFYLTQLHGRKLSYEKLKKKIANTESSMVTIQLV